jgi:hypothetical protein
MDGPADLRALAMVTCRQQTSPDHQGHVEKGAGGVQRVGVIIMAILVKHQSLLEIL